MKVNKIVKTAMVCFLSLFTVFSLTAVNVDNNNIFTEINAQETGHITINANTDVNGDFQSLANKKFNVYKIFDAENSAGMESINYTMNPAYAEALKKVTRKSTEYEIIDYLQELNNNLVIGDVSHTQENESTYSNFRYLIENLRNEIVTEKVEPTMTVTVPEDATDSYTLDVPFGWYIVDEVTQVEGTHSAASLCMVNTANPNVEIDIKSDYPMIIKQIREDNNRSNIGQNNDGWNDVADFEIGQTVPFRLGTFVPNINGYKTYYFAIHDRMDEALTFNEDSVVVKLGNFTLEKDVDYTVVTTGIPEDETFQIQFKDLKATVNKYYYSAEPVSESEETEKEYGQFIEVNYNATLNDKAQLDTGRPGFENDVKLEFSNNPDSDGTGQTGETPWDTVVCFTFRMDGIKVNDQSERPLQGAKFKLYADEECTKEIKVKTGIEEGSYVVISRDEDEDKPMPHNENEGVEIISNENGIFNIIGLDSQTYYLKEIKAPAGYRLLKDPIKIDIKATYDDENRENYVKGDGANKTLKKLEATASFKEFYSGEYSEYDNNLTTDVETGTMNIKVVNKVGSKLPATGSIVTIILVGAGTAIMGSVLIKNRKKEAE